MRLIDADALMQSLGITNMDCDECAWYDNNEWSRCKRGGDFEDACFAIENAPTVDAIEVVRCKDCNRWNPAFDREVSEYGVCQIRSQHIATKRDFFCSKGERRSDG